MSKLFNIPLGSLGILVLLSGCTKTAVPSPEAQAQQTFSYSHENRDITVNVGDEFSIELQDGGGTGYMWYLLACEPPQEKDLFKFIRKEIVTEQKSDPMLMGGPGPKYRWIFKATRASDNPFIPLIFIDKGPGGNPPAKQIALYVKVVSKTKK